MIIIIKKILFPVFVCITLFGCSSEQTNQYETNNQSNLYNKIIENFATKEGLLKTDLARREIEYLAESQGLLMQYFLQQNMKKNFQLATKVLENHFLLKNNIISWQIINDEKSPTNALIDDLRIIEALKIASEKWDDSNANQLATQLIEGNKQYTMKDGYLINYSSENQKNRTDEINLSYINKKQFEYFNFPDDQLGKQLAILEKTPISEKAFYPLKFTINDKKYVFDEKVHMVDQLLTAINFQEVKPNSNGFYEQLKFRFNRDQKIAGVYDLKSGKPSVNYESPAVYSYAIELARVKKDDEFEKQLLKRLNLLKNNQKDSAFYGTFISEPSKETHIFDNLMPLQLEEGNK